MVLRCTKWPKYQRAPTSIECLFFFLPENSCFLVVSFDLIFAFSPPPCTFSSPLPVLHRIDVIRDVIHSGFGELPELFRIHLSLSHCHFHAALRFVSGLHGAFIAGALHSEWDASSGDFSKNVAVTFKVEEKTS